MTDDPSSEYGEVRMRPKKAQLVSANMSAQQLLDNRKNAYIEDLAEWLADLFSMNITRESFFRDLENGVRLCQLAKAVSDGEGPDGPNKIPPPDKYKPRATPGTFHARDNVAAFLHWVRGYDIDNAVLFEVPDLVDRKNELHVLYCLMELARVQTGIPPPLLIEIERSMSKNVAPSISREEQLGLEFDIKAMMEKIGKGHLELERVGPAEYKFGTLGPYKVAKLRRHIMVLSNKKWDTLEHLLITLDKSGEGASRPMLRRRRNSLVQDTVHDRERRMSIQNALSVEEARRLSRRASVMDDGEDPFKAFAVAGESARRKRSLQRRSTISDSSLVKSPSSDAGNKRNSGIFSGPTLAEMQAQIDDLKKSLKESESDKERLGQMLEEEQQRALNMQSELEDAASMQEDAQKTARTIAELNDERDMLSMKLKTTTERLKEDHRSQVAELQDRLTKLEEAKTSAQAADADLQTQLAQAQEQIALLKEALQEQKELFENEARTRTEKNAKHLEEMEADHDEEVRELEEEIEAQRKVAKSTVEEATAIFDKEMAAKETEIAALQAQLQESTEGTANRLQHEVDELKEKVKELSARVASQQEEMDVLAKEKRLADAAIADKDHEITGLKNQLEDTEGQAAAQVTALKQAHGDEIAKLKAAIDAAEESASQGSNSLEERVSKLRSEKEKQEQAHATALAEIKAAKALVDDELAASRAKVAQLESDLQQATDAVKSLEEDVQARASVSQSSLDDVKAEVEAKRRESEALLQRAQASEERAQSLESTIAILSKERDEYKASVAQNSETSSQKQQALHAKEAELSALKLALEKATSEASKHQAAADDANGRLTEMATRARTAELKLKEAEASAASSRSLLEAEKAAFDEKLAKMRDSVESEQNGEKVRAREEVQSLMAELSRSKDVAIAKEAALSEMSSQLDEMKLAMQQETSTVQRLTVEVETLRAEEKSLKESLEAKVQKLERKLEVEREEADHRVASTEAKMHSSFKAQSQSYEQDIKKMQDLIATLRKESDVASFSIQTEAAEKLRQAEKKVEEVEANAVSQRQRHENDMKSLRLRCMEAERKESSARLEKDMTKQKHATLESKFNALNTQYNTLKERHKKDIQDLEDKLHTDGAMGARASATMLAQPFAEMTMANLTPSDVDALCLYDEGARDTNLDRLRARAALDAADFKLQAAIRARDANPTRETQESVEKAKSLKYQAETALHDAEVAFHAAARRALHKLQEEEKTDALPSDRSLREMLLNAHARAQMRIAELEVALDGQKHAAELDEVSALSGARAKYAADIKALNDKRAADAARIKELEAEVERLKATTDLNESMRSVGHLREHNLMATVADWMNQLLETSLTAETLMDELQDGKVLCNLANVIDEVEEGLREIEAEEGPSNERVITREHEDLTEFVSTRDLMEVHFLDDATAGSEGARSNINAFVEWAESLGIKYPPVFDADDLMKNEDHRRVAEGIMDVAYRVRGLPLPPEVEEHRENAEVVHIPQPALDEEEEALEEEPQYEHIRGDRVDEKVAEVLHFVPQMKAKLRRVAQGKYRLGRDNRILLMRVLQDKVMVRVGGGWMDLRQYLIKHSKRRSKTGSTSQQTREADAAVETILNSTEGPGLCSTRTKLPGHHGRRRRRRPNSAGRHVSVEDVEPFEPLIKDVHRF